MTFLKRVLLSFSITMLITVLLMYINPTFTAKASGVEGILIYTMVYIIVAVAFSDSKGKK